jgi:hypothetical protein
MILLLFLFHPFFFFLFLFLSFFLSFFVEADFHHLSVTSCQHL